MSNKLTEYIRTKGGVLALIGLLCALFAGVYLVPRLFKKEINNYESTLETGVYHPSRDTFKEFLEKETTHLQPNAKDKKTTLFTVELSKEEKEALRKNYEEGELLPYDALTLAQAAGPNKLNESEKAGIERARFNRQVLEASPKTFEAYVAAYKKLKQKPAVRKKILNLWNTDEKQWKQYIDSLVRKESIKQKGKSGIDFLIDNIVPERLQNLVGSTLSLVPISDQTQAWFKMPVNALKKILSTPLVLLFIAIITFLKLHQSIIPSWMVLSEYIAACRDVDKLADLSANFQFPLEDLNKKWKPVLFALAGIDSNCVTSDWYQKAKAEALGGSIYYYITWVAPTILSSDPEGGYHKEGISVIVSLTFLYVLLKQIEKFTSASGKQSKKMSLNAEGAYCLTMVSTILTSYFFCGGEKARELAFSMERPFQLWYLCNIHTFLGYVNDELLTKWLGWLVHLVVLLSIAVGYLNSFVVKVELEHFLRSAKELSRSMDELVQDKTMTPMESTRQWKCMQAYVSKGGSVKEILGKVEANYLGGVYVASLYNVFSGTPHHEDFVDAICDPKKGQKWKNALFAYKDLVDIALFIENEEQAKGSGDSSLYVIPDTVKYSNAKRPVIEITGAYSLKQYKEKDNKTEKEEAAKEANKNKEELRVFNKVRLGRGMNVAILVGEENKGTAYVQMVAQQIVNAAITGKIAGNKATLCFPDKLFYADAKRESYEAHYQRLGDILHYARCNPDKKILMLIANAYGGVAVKESADLLYAYCKVLNKLPNVTCLLSTSDTRVYECLQTEDNFNLLMLQLDQEKKPTGIVMSGKNEKQLVTEYLLKQKVTSKEMKEALRKTKTSSRDAFLGINDPYARNIILALFILFLLIGLSLFFYMRRSKTKEL